MHLLAYLTPKRAVAWKCLSLEASGSGACTRFAPVAYSSLSRSFFPGAEGTRSPGVLWVISAPTYRRTGMPRVSFPPTLTAKLVVDQILTGDRIRRWAGDRCDCRLEVPSGDEAFQRWRQARSVPGAIRRATFRITRNFAMIARRRGHSERDAWARVRTAIADRRRSRFFAHVDAGGCLRQALRLAPGEKVGSALQSPRRVRSEASVTLLEQLASTGTTCAIFMNYRWNRRSIDVARLARKLLALRCGVWLDGLAIPHFNENPIFRTGRTRRRKDPPAVDLERLLQEGIKASTLFLCLAAHDYEGAPKDRPEGSRNWARQEYDFAVALASETGGPRIRVVDLGGAPDAIRNAHPGWSWSGDEARILAEIAAAARPS